MSESGKEVIFINHRDTDCKAYHDVIHDNDSMNGPVTIINCVIAALAYLKLGGDFMLIISPDDFPGDMEPLKTYIMNNNIPFIFRYPGAFIKDNKLGDIRHIVDSLAENDVVKLAIDNWLDKISKNEPVVLPKEIDKSSPTLKTTINSILLYDEYNEPRLEYKSEISDMIRKGDWTWFYLDNNKMRKSRKTIDELVDELKGEGIIKVHASMAVCKDKAVNIYYDDRYKIVMPNDRIVTISRPNEETVVPVIRKILEDKGVVVSLREERKG